MATYYVSSQRGSDSNPGTSQASPWLTLGHAASTVAAGDTVYIGPGVYREQLVIATSGGSSSPIRWMGDPACRYLVSDRPGTVHLTRYNASWQAQAGAALNLNALNYNLFYDMTIDGSSDQTVAGGGIGNEIYRCSIQAAQNGVNGVCTLWDCFVSGGQNAVTGGVTTQRCILSGASCGGNTGAHENSIAFGGDTGFSGATCFNCSAIAVTFGFDDCTCRNCAAITCFYGFYASVASGGLCSSCYASTCRYGYYGEVTSALNVGALCLYSSCVTAQRGAGTYEVGTVTQGGAVFFDWSDMRKVLEPWYSCASSLRSTGDNSWLPDVDCLGRSRPLGNGTVGIGAWELPDDDATSVAGEYYLVPPAWKCHRMGQKIFEVAVEAGNTVTVSVFAKHANQTVNPPSIVIRGKDGLTISSSVHSGGTGWQRLTVMADALEDTIFEVVCKSNVPDTGAWAYFSDFETSLALTAGSGIKYGNVLLTATATVAATGTEIAGGGSSTVWKKGNLVQGTHRGNWTAWSSSNNTRAGLVFFSNHSGNLTRLYVQFRSTGTGYYAGDGGTYTVRIHADNGSGTAPGSVLTGGTVSGAQPGNIDHMWEITGFTCTLAKDTQYWVTFQKTSDSSNWGSMNALSCEDIPWPHVAAYKEYGARLCESFDSGVTWQPWSTNNPGYWIDSTTYNAGPTAFFMWIDGGFKEGWPMNSCTSDSPGPLQMYGSRKFGVRFTWNGTSGAQLLKVGTAWIRMGSPTGGIYWHLDDITAGTTLQSGALLAASSAWTAQYDHFKEVTVSGSITLTNGHQYRLWFDAPSGTSSSNYYQLHPPYTFNVDWCIERKAFGGTEWLTMNTAGTWDFPSNQSYSMSYFILTDID